MRIRSGFLAAEAATPGGDRSGDECFYAAGVVGFFFGLRIMATKMPPIRPTPAPTPPPIMAYCWRLRRPSMASPSSRWLCMSVSGDDAPAGAGAGGCINNCPVAKNPTTPSTTTAMSTIAMFFIPTLSERGLEIENRVHGGGQLVVAGQAVEKVPARIVVADFRADLERADDGVVGKGRDRQADGGFVKVLCDARGEGFFVAVPLRRPATLNWSVSL